jgi:hypothetical protein
LRIWSSRPMKFTRYTHKRQAGIKRGEKQYTPKYGWPIIQVYNKLCTISVVQQHNQPLMGTNNLGVSKICIYPGSV